MNSFLYVLFLSFFSLDWLALKLDVLPRVFKFIPEILSIIAWLIVVIRIPILKTIALSPYYMILFIFYLSIFLGGLIVNHVSAGVIITACRSYLLYLPFFLLPCVYSFTDAQISRHLKFLLFLSLIQCPVSLYQRFVKYAGVGTGDVVGGTLGANTSGVLSVYLVCTISMVLAFYLKGKINRLLLFLLVTILFIPITINETKFSLFILPFALVSPFLFLTTNKAKLRNVLLSSAITIVILFIFTGIYNKIYVSTNRATLETQLKSGGYHSYLYYGDENLIRRRVGRFDSIELAFRQLSKSGHLLIGVGAGNASPCSFKKMEGEYFKKFGHYDPTATYLTKTLWEFGIVGVILSIVFLLLVLRDAIALRVQNDIVGAISLGWISVIFIIGGSFIYFNTFGIGIISYLFWYISGYLASKRFNMCTE